MDTLHSRSSRGSAHRLAPLLLLALAGAARAQWGVSGTDIFSTNAGEVGIGTSIPVYKLSVISSGQARAVYALNPTATGATFGGYFRANSDGGTGIHGVAASLSGETYGVWGLCSSPDGIGVYGRALTLSGLGTGVMGESTRGAGVQGDSDDGPGVIGYSVNASGVRGSSGSGIGVSGYSNLTGVEGRGLGPESSGVVGIGGLHIQLASSLPTSGVRGRLESFGVRGYAVLGETPYATTGNWAVYALGRLGASGTKSFQIDHPADPANKYLLHYCAEGPEPLNIYRGSVDLDATGAAWVHLPDYFELINRDPGYTLTPIGAAAPLLHVAEEVQGNRFRIAGGMPGQKVSWRIEAARHDPWVRAHGAPVVQDKPEGQRGTYLHPELYGQPREAAETYTPPAPRPPASGAKR